MSFYDYKAKKMNGQEISMSDYKDKVVVVVNTASQCGYTPQLDSLEEIYESYKDQGLEILGFPCNQFAHQDAGSNEEIEAFCKVNYGVTFTMFQKIEVNGTNAHPLYKFLRKEQHGLLTDRIQWNFTKFLIDKEGRVVRRVAPKTTPEEMVPDIQALLSAK